MESDWVRVDAEVAEILAARPGEYNQATIRSLTVLLDLVRSTKRPAPLLSPGYWPTFCLEWLAEEAKNLQIEVFDGRYEVCRFFDGKTDIWYEHHAEGEAFSQAFQDELPNPR